MNKKAQKSATLVTGEFKVNACKGVYEVNIDKFF